MSSKWKTVAVIGLAAITASAAFATTAATAKRSSTKAAAGPVVVGLAMAKSGFMAEFDGPDVLGAQMAIQDINKAGGLLGRQLKSVQIDSKSDKAANAQAVTQLLQQGAQMIVSSCDLDFGGPGALLASKAEKIVLGCAGDPRWGKQGLGKNAFTINTVTPGEGSAGAEWAFYRKGWRSVYLLNDSFIQYTKALGGYFKTRWNQLPGTSVVGEDNFKNTDTSFTTQVSRIRSLSDQPDFIYMTACPPGGPTLLRQLRAAGVRTPVLSDNCVIGDFWVKSVPGLKDFWQTAYLSPYLDDKRPAVNTFYKRFLKLYPRVVQRQFGALGYSQIQAYALAVRRAKSFDTAKVRAQMERFRNVPLLIGPTTWTANLHSDTTRPVAILAVFGGRHHAVEYYKPKKPVPPKF